MPETISKSQLEEIISVLNQCTDEFIFIIDGEADTCVISRQAMDVFDIPAERFSNASAVFDRLVYEEDRAMLKAEQDLIKTGKKNTHNLEYRWINREGKPTWISCRGKVTKIGNGSSVLLGRISLLNEADKVDYLTHLPIESQLRSDFAQIWTQKQKVSGFMMKIDIDNLGLVNEQYGVNTGDKVLTIVADCCRKACAGLSHCYKLNSDEFICVNLEGLKASDAQKFYINLKRLIADAEQEMDYDVMFTVSVGLVAFYSDPSQFDELLKKVNFAVSEAKRKGRNNITMFNATDYNKHLRNIDLQEKMRESVKNNFAGFELYFQPVINAQKLYCDKGDSVFNVIGAEALLRWRHPDYGMMVPDDFIPILEKSGLIIPVGRWILLSAFTLCREWNKIQKDFHMSVNLSYIQVRKSDVLTDVQMALEKSKVRPENIVLELTESGYMDSDSELRSLLEDFSKMGLKIDIDDFGTGYSNLRYLQYLHANTLKLDYSFVHKATGGDEGDRKVIKHITQMAHELDMEVCMEGIESMQDIEKLEQYSPDKFQGFYFGRPCSASDFREHYLRPDAVFLN